MGTMKDESAHALIYYVPPEPNMFEDSKNTQRKRDGQIATKKSNTNPRLRHIGSTPKTGRKGGKMTESRNQSRIKNQISKAAITTDQRNNKKINERIKESTNQRISIKSKLQSKSNQHL